MKKRIAVQAAAAALAGIMAGSLPVCAEEGKENHTGCYQLSCWARLCGRVLFLSFEEFQKTEEGKSVEFNFEEIPTTDPAPTIKDQAFAISS